MYKCFVAVHCEALGGQHIRNFIDEMIEVARTRQLPAVALFKGNVDFPIRVTAKSRASRIEAAYWAACRQALTAKHRIYVSGGPPTTPFERGLNQRAGKRVVRQCGTLVRRDSKGRAIR